MQSKKLNPALKQSFETRLVRYTVAGGALLAAPAAHATMIYSGPLDTVATAGQNIDVSFDPLASGITNFTIEVSTSQIDVTGSLGSVFFDIGPLTAGTPITLADVTSNPLLALVTKLNTTPLGLWHGVSDPAYLAVKFTVSSELYLGWAELQINESTPSATLLGYAYNDEPSAPIVVGDTGAAPEPGSLSLFALGAAGVLALRRRRAA